MFEDRKVSIIIPVFNAEMYLRECIESVVGQSHKNIEMIFINDGSTDSSLRLLNEYKANDDRIVIIDQPNGGVSSARNAGLLAARGDYITFLDSDDYYKEDAIKTLLEAFQGESIDASFARFDISNLDPGSRFVYGPYEKKDGSPKEAMMVMLKHFSYGTMLWNKMFNANVLKKNGETILFNTNLKCGEDEVWLFEVLHNCRKIAFLSEEIYFWRVRQGSAYREVTIRDTNVDDVKAQEFILNNNLSIGPEVTECVAVLLNRKTFEYMVRSYLQKKHETMQIITSIGHIFIFFCCIQGKTLLYTCNQTRWFKCY